MAEVRSLRNTFVADNFPDRLPPRPTGEPRPRNEVGSGEESDPQMTQIGNQKCGRQRQKQKKTKKRSRKMTGVDGF
jgi:hypothetical protein